VFVATTINGKVAEVGPVYPRITRAFGRSGKPETKYAFIVRQGSLLEHRVSTTEAMAEQERAALLGTGTEVNHDWRDRTVMDLLSRHITATCSPQADGSVKIVADTGEATYVVLADGSIGEAVAA
jgi:hypothetical protein